MTVVEVPIVVRNDLKKIGNSPKLRNRIPKFPSAEAVESFPFPCVCADYAGLLRWSLEIARRAECTMMPVGIMIDQGRRGTGTSQGTMSSTGNRPHFSSGQKISLFHRAVG